MNTLGATCSKKKVIADADAALRTSSGLAPGSCAFQPLERFEFYAAARTAFAVVQTSERRPYGNFLIRKGVVGPDGKDLLP